MVERQTLCRRLCTLAWRIEATDRGNAALLTEAAQEICRLRAVIRVNGVRAGSSHAEIDAVVYPDTPA